MKIGMFKRRILLKSAVLSGLAMALPVPVLAQSLTTTSLGGSLSLISGAGCNVVVAVGPESVVVVDGGLQENADALLAEINRLGQGKPITTLFNTNWRPEHCGLNYLLGGSGVDIIAHENTRLWQGADFQVAWEEQVYSAMPTSVQANKPFYKTGSLDLGEETIEYGWIGKGHTDGDIYIHFTQADVLVVSDLLGVSAYPVLDYVTGGFGAGLRDITEKLIEKANNDTKIIAADGLVQSVADLQVQHEMLEQAFASVTVAYQTGKSLDEFLEMAPTAGFDERWGDPVQFVSLLYRGTWYHVPGRAVPLII